jgi:hypothetical protein
MSHPKVLIEDWLPIEAIGAESKRERGASSALPPLYFLHVWWARRPLIASRAAILASVLPVWSEDWPEGITVTSSQMLRSIPGLVHWSLLGHIVVTQLKLGKYSNWAKSKGVNA